MRLIWLVEYSDLLKIGIVAVVIAGILLGCTSEVSRHLYVITEDPSPRGRRFQIGFGLLFLFFLGDAVVTEFFTPERDIAAPVFQFLTAGMLIVLPVAFIYVARRRPLLTSLNAFIVGVPLVMFVASFGRTLGDSVRRVGGPGYDVIAKDERIRDAAIVLVTSHHTVLSTKDRIFVFQRPTWSGWRSQ